MPLLADLKPGGRFVASTCTAPAAPALVANRLRAAGALHDDAITVSGRTIGEEAAAAVETPGQEVVRPMSAPLKAHRRAGRSCAATSRRTGCVVKVAGHDFGTYRGPARVFDGEEAAFEAVQAGRIHAGDVVVIRHEGPKGGPGMREMLGGHRRPSSARDSAIRWRSSPTAGSRAQRTA